MPGHGHRVFIDVPSPPRSPRRAHYRRHSLTLDERPAYVFRDDLDMMQERENGLRVANDTLQRHNQILKGQLQGKEKTIRDQQAWIDQLEVENHELRRSLESNSDVDSRRETKIRDLRRKNTKLEAENDSLKMRVREVLRIAKEATDDRVRQLKDEVSETTWTTISLPTSDSPARTSHCAANSRLKKDYADDTATEDFPLNTLPLAFFFFLSCTA
jgi:hypothetical protein